MVREKKTEFNKELFENLCKICCTVKEIENILKTDKKIITRFCEEIYGEDFYTVHQKFADEGKASVRRNQLALSKTSAAMAIWLGKQMLNQRDSQYHNLDAEIQVNVVHYGSKEATKWKQHASADPSKDNSHP